MEKAKTIVEVVKIALLKLNQPLSIKSIYNYIIENDLYQFNAEDPQHIVQTMIRRHALGLDFPSASPKKHFKKLLDGTYWLIDKSIPGQSDESKKQEVKIQKDTETLSSIVIQLKSVHIKHSIAFKTQIINQLKQMSPNNFELFSRNLLEVYGFKKMEVTKQSKDGGIDGYGQLKVGITHLNVAFQSKRWKNNPIGRVEIDRFRGATQGEYEQGIIFTTSKFTKDALAATRKPGAVPIILIDGEAMVDIMIEKRFGIEIENMPVYINALDNVLND